MAIAETAPDVDYFDDNIVQGVFTDESLREAQIEQLRHTAKYEQLDEEFRKQQGEEALLAREALKQELLSEVRRNPFAYPRTDTSAGVTVDEDGTVDEAQALHLVERELLPHAEAIAAQKGQEKARERAQAHGQVDPPAPLYNLTNFLTTPIPELRYRVEGMNTIGDTLLISAEYKVGKSTFMMNLMKSIADGEDFLGRPVTPLEPGRSIVYWDLEQSAPYTQKQFSKMGIKNTDVIYPYNGIGHKIDLENEEFQKHTIRILRDLNCEVLVIDTFTQAFDGEENSNTEQREWFKNLDRIIKLAEVSDLIIVGHMGHGQNRQRGASYLLGHVAQIVTVQRTSQDEDDTTRKVTVEGRNVEKHSLHYGYDRETNTISEIDAPASTRQNSDDFAQRVFKVVQDSDNSSTVKSILKDLDLEDGSRKRVTKALNTLVERGELKLERGEHNTGYYSAAQLGHTVAPY